MNNYNDPIITIPADSFFFTEAVFNAERNKVLDGSNNPEVNEMVKSSDIIDETHSKKNHPFIRKLVRK